MKRLLCLAIGHELDLVNMHCDAMFDRCYRCHTRMPFTRARIVRETMLRGALIVALLMSFGVVRFAIEHDQRPRPKPELEEEERR